MGMRVLMDLVIHVGLGLVLGIFFTAAALSKKKSDEFKAANEKLARKPIIFGNILTVAIAFVALILIMKFARDYQPRSWINLAALLATWIISGLASWHLIFSYKRSGQSKQSPIRGRSE